jgi:hypothetical protein
MLELDKLGILSSTQLYKGVETLAAVLNNLELSTEESAEVVSTLLGILQSEDELPNGVLSNKRWHQLYPGSVRDGWIVRVKPNCFSGELEKYNGMIGRIAHTSYGRAKINNVIMANKNHYFNIDDLEYFL